VIKFVIRFAILSVLVTTFVAGIGGDLSSAHASSVSDDPLVIVSLDKTQSSSCTEIFQANIGTAQASTKRISCPPGTIMVDAKEHRSQAIAQHEAYVIIPSAQASSVVYQQYLKQIKIIHASKQAHLRSLSLTSQYAHPATRCGKNGGASLTWNTDGGSLNASIGFTKSTDCSTAYFGDSQLNTTAALQYGRAWGQDAYASNQWGVPNCPSVVTVGHRFHLVSQSGPIGYYYENDLYGSLGGPITCKTDFGPYYDNIGPIN